MPLAAADGVARDLGGPPVIRAVVQVSRPSVNLPAAKPPSPDAVKLRSPVSATTDPVPL